MNAFATDVAKAVQLNSNGTTKSRLAMFVLNSELHCVAAYRFGQFVERMRARTGVWSLPALLTHRVWNRYNTHVHHCNISRGARIGPGFLLMHRWSVMIGPSVIGANVVVHHNVTIGDQVARGSSQVPRIGDGVWIGPGAILTGAITIGDGATISAGAVVMRDVPPHALVAGNPGRVISTDYDNRGMINFELPTARGPVQSTSVSPSPAAA